MLPSGKFFRKNIAISPDFVYTGRYIDHSSLRRKQVSSPPVQPHPAASRRGRQFCLPRLFLLFFYSAGIRIFSVGIAPYFRSPGAAIVPVPALSALLPNRLLHFSGFFDRPDIPPFPTLSSAWIPPFPGAAIISAPASFLCRSYAGIFSFPESIAVRCPEVFSLPVFRFWISKRAAFIPLDFALSFFRSASAGFVQLLPHFLTLERPGFCPAFVQLWTPFCPAAGGASLIEPLWEASYPPVSIRRGPSVFYPSPK